MLVIGLGGSALICALFPLFMPTLGFVLQMTCLLGLCCGIAFGSSYQLVSHFSVICNMALTIGKASHIFLHMAVILWLFWHRLWQANCGCASHVAWHLSLVSFHSESYCCKF